MSSEFSVRWKGALYGINYENWRSSALYRSGRTLVELCCQVIVRDAAFTKNVISILPQELLYSLMKAAVERGRHCTVKVLLEAWPSRTLAVSVLTPHYHRSGQLLYDRLLYSIQLEDAVRLTSLLIHTFIQLAQQAPQLYPGKLKVLDLEGFPVVEPVLQLVSHTIAERHFHYECPAQRHPYAECIGNRSHKRQRQNGHTQRGCKCDPYIIRMDCFIRDDIILDELCRALRVCRTSSPHLVLQVSKIDAVCLGERSLLGLLKLLDTQLLTGMGLEYNGFCNDGVIHLGPQISRFCNMTALDLSCNNINMPQNAQVCSALGKMLEKLTKLTRLDLSNNKLAGCLRPLFSHMALPSIIAPSSGCNGGRLAMGPPLGLTGLEYLKLSACQLKEDDVEFLASCSFLISVRELDLSENLFSSKMQGLMRLLDTLRNSLQVLELEDCGFTSSQLPLLVDCISRLWGLRYLNVARNHLSIDDLILVLPTLRALPNLECIRLSSSSTWLEDSSLPAGNGAHFGYELSKRRRVEKAVQEQLGSTVGAPSSSGRTSWRLPVLVVWDDPCMDD